MSVERRGAVVIGGGISGLAAGFHLTRAGVAVTLCTDGWLMCGVALTDEYWLAHTALGVTREEMNRMILNGFASAFLAWPEKQALIAGVRDELEGAA